MSWASQVMLVVKNPSAKAGGIRDESSIPELGRSPGGGHGNPLQYSCLENPMDRGACQATVRGVAKSWTRLSDWTELNVCVHSRSLWSYLTFCYPMDCNLPGSSVRGILQARILEWVAMPSSRGSSQPSDRTRVSYISCVGRWVLYCLHHLGSPNLSKSTP